MLSSLIVLGIFSTTALLGCRAIDQDLSDVRYDGKWKLEGWDKPPGFKARITEKGLDFVKKIGIVNIEQKIGQIQIPDMTGYADITVTTIKYTVSNMKIISINIPTASLNPNSQVQGMDLRASSINLSLRGNWKYVSSGWISISDSGTFNAATNSISLSLTLRIGVDSKGRPTVKSGLSDCSFYIRNLNLDIHGGGSWFYNMFKSQIVDSIKSSVNGKVCSNIVNMVNTDLETKLQTLKMMAPVEDVIEVDYSLIKSPTFYGAIDTQNKGEVYPLKGKRVECPFPIQTIPVDKDASRMVILWITEYLPNSAGYVLQKVGFLHYTVTPDNVSPQYKKYMNTSSMALKLVLPQIGKMYPNMGLQMSLESSKAPMANITPDAINATFVGKISPSAILPNKTLAPLFTLNLTITTTLDVSTNRNNITWKMFALSTKMSLVSSAIGSLDIDKLQKMFNSLVKPMFIAQLNKIGAVGIPLPQVEGFTFTKPTITLGKGYLKVGTDLKYTPMDS